MSVTSSGAARVVRRPARMLISVIEVYRHMISPLRLPSCRFMPTCSQYAVDAITEFGLFRGGWLALRRLGRCGPWHTGGWDPIPDRCAESAEGAKHQLRSANV
ncbi:MAG: membrane protein insertion efficiency factor YidD [Mycobacteriaceae bacterium]